MDAPRSRSALLLVLVVALVALAVAVAGWDLEGEGVAPPPQPELPAPAEPAEEGTEPAVATPPGERTVSLLPSSTITLRGTVRSRLGRPLADVVVLLDGKERDFELHTDVAGRFAVDDLPRGGYRVIALGPAILTHTEFAEVRPDMPPLLLTVDEGAPLRGEVLDASGRPIDRARVTPWRRGPSGEELEPRCAVQTDVLGRFALRGAVDGPTFVLVERDGFTTRKVRLDPQRWRTVQLVAAK